MPGPPAVRGALGRASVGRRVRIGHFVAISLSQATPTSTHTAYPLLRQTSPSPPFHHQAVAPPRRKTTGRPRPPPIRDFGITGAAAAWDNPFYHCSLRRVVEGPPPAPTALSSHGAARPFWRCCCVALGGAAYQMRQIGRFTSWAPCAGANSNRGSFTRLTRTVEVQRFPCGGALATAFRGIAGTEPTKTKGG